MPKPNSTLPDCVKIRRKMSEAALQKPQMRKKSRRGLDGLEWLLWQFYRSTDDIFTEDGAESFPPVDAVFFL